MLWSPGTRHCECDLNLTRVNIVSLSRVPQHWIIILHDAINSWQYRSLGDICFGYQHQRSTLRTLWEFNFLAMTQTCTSYWTHFHRLLGSDHLLLLPCCLFTFIWSTVFGLCPSSSSSLQLQVGYSHFTKFIISGWNYSYRLSKIWNKFLLDCYWLFRSKITDRI